MLDDPGHRDHLVTPHDERPGFPFRWGDLRVDEHVLDLLLAPGEPVAGPPTSYLKPFERGADAPLAPGDLALDVDGAALEPEAVVLAHRLAAAAEIDALRADPGGEQLGERGRQRLADVEGAEDVRVGGRV